MNDYELVMKFAHLFSDKDDFRTSSPTDRYSRITHQLKC